MRLQINMHKNPDRMRFLCIPAGFLVISCLGLSYAESLYVNPLIDLGASTNFLAMSNNIYTVLAVVMAIAGGKLLEKYGPSNVNFFGIATLVLGTAITSLVVSHGVIWYLVGLIITTWGYAVIYIAVYDNINRWFPDMKGTAMAITGMGIAVCGTFAAPLAASWIEHFGFGGQFIVMGIAFGVLGYVGLIFFPNAPEGYTPKGYKPLLEEDETGNIPDVDPETGFIQKNWKMLLKDPCAYMLFLLPIVAVLTGMVISGHATWMAEDILGLTPTKAAWFISAFMASNTVGKLVFGALGDIIGRLWNAIIIYAINAGATVLFLLIMTRPGMASVAAFTIGCIAIGFTFGGSSTLMAAMTSDLFGSKYFGLNFAILSQAPNFGYMLAPWIAFTAKSGGAAGYGKCFTLCLIGACLGLVFAIIMKIVRKDNVQKIRKLTDEEKAARAAKAEATAAENTTEE